MKAICFIHTKLSPSKCRQPKTNRTKKQREWTRDGEALIKNQLFPFQERGLKNVQKTQLTNFLRQPSVRDNEDPAEPSCLCARDNKTRDPNILCKARFTILFLKLNKIL